MKHFMVFLGAILLCQLAGLAGSFFTFPAIGDWYVYLQKPFFAPPNWVFAPVWTALYLMMGMAWYLVLTSTAKRPVIATASKQFALQLGLNVAWSLLFFGLRSPGLGLVGIAALWWAIVLTMRQFFPISKTAGYLLLPYWLWVSFASVLNLAVVLLN